MFKFLRMIKQNKLAFILYTLFLCLMLYFFHYNKIVKTEEHILALQKQYKAQYKSMYTNFKQLAENTFYGIINTPKIYDNVKLAYHQDKQTQQKYREKLYNSFLADYSRLVNFNFKQLHFHFPDNTSFLRMHRPDKFGDDLSSIRYSVVQVNKTLKPIDGFEMGKILHGFRYVFPLHDSNLQHIGSVETSVSTKFFERYYEETYNVDAHFLLQKTIFEAKVFPEILKKQKTSFENDQYFITNESPEENIHFVSPTFFTPEEKSFIKTKMSHAEEFILVKKHKSNYFTISYLPIKNIEGIPNCGYLVLYKKSDIIEHINTSYYKMNFILALTTLIFFFLLNLKFKKDEKNKQKDLILTQQSKMAAMGEMIANIAHQWRQPLSVISTAATGMKLQKEFGMLEDKMFFENMDRINDNAQYLSQTIEDFRNFFSDNKQKKPFFIKDLIEKSLRVFGSTLETENIKIIQNIDDIEITSLENELKQVIINLIKNAKDIIKKDGVIIIKAWQKNDTVTLTFQDSGGGIPEDVLDRIFEPYFTTKHQSVGTGLGLYMSHEIIVKNLHGTITARNKNFSYEFKSYSGALFTITLNLQKL